VGIENGLLSIFFPTKCAGCKRYIKDFKYSYLCPECYKKLRSLPERVCPVCAKPINSKHADGCRECRERRNNFSYVRPAGIYEGALKEIIHYMKFNKKKRLARVLSGFMLERVNDDIFKNVDYMVAVPSGKASMSERGYDQTGIMAGYLSKARNIPVLKKAVKKRRETPAQNTLGRKERMRNLKGAFSANMDLTGKIVLVVDDVFTTGATINEVARALKEAGAKEVRGITAARSV
jgi:ComF family protein